MIVIVKEPGKHFEKRDVEGIEEINRLVGNVDENGKGVNYGSSDTRDFIAPGIDMYCNANALYNNDLEPNLWNKSDTGVLCGTVVFAGYDQEDTMNAGAVSLKEEQIEIISSFINKQMV
jgi:hypothetical protein